MKVALYARISQDRDGTERGVGRQLDDARGHARQRGWTVVDEYVDDDVSAYNGAHRPAYAEMMAKVKAGELEGIVCYQTSRLWRSRTERAAAIEELSTRRVIIATVNGMDFDLTSAMGRMIAAQVGEFDTAESAIKSERVAREVRQRAEDGRRHGKVTYGWRKVPEEDDHGRVIGWRDEEHPEEAKVVRDLADRIIAGDSMRSIVVDLNDRGVPPPSGKPDARWHPSSVRAVVLRPANVARRVYRGEVIGDAAWPPIMDRDRYDTVRAVLQDPRRSFRRPTTRKHLLTGKGIGFCGVCGKGLRVKQGKRSFVAYQCRDGHVSRRQDMTDALVGQVVIERLRRPDAAEVFRRPVDRKKAEEARSEADRLRLRLDSAAEDYADGVIDRQQLGAITSRLRPHLEEAERQVAEALAHEGLSDVALLFTGDPAVAWDTLDVVERSRVIEALGLTVKLLPTGKGRSVFRPEDVAIEWGAM